MNTVEDFESAPIGATATHDNGTRAMKMISGGEPRWIARGGSLLDVEGMVQWGYTLDSPVPTTAREAVELVWELAHEVREGQVIPEGAWLVERRDNKITVEKNTFFDIAVDEWGAENFRTLEPLPEPEPDWIDAPALLARLDAWNRDERAVFVPTSTLGRWTRADTDWTYHWHGLRDVTPLYPKAGQDA